MLYRLNIAKQHLQFIFMITEYCVGNDLPAPRPSREAIHLVKQFYDQINPLVLEYEVRRTALVDEKDKAEANMRGMQTHLKGLPIINSKLDEVNAMRQKIHELDDTKCSLLLSEEMKELFTQCAAAIWENKDGRDALMRRLLYQDNPMINLRTYIAMLADLDGMVPDDGTAAPVPTEGKGTSETAPDAGITDDREGEGEIKPDDGAGSTAPAS